MQKTRISAFPTIKLAFLGVLITALLVPAVIDDVFAGNHSGSGGSGGSGGGCTGGGEGPKIDITYSYDGPYLVESKFTITLTSDKVVKTNQGWSPKIIFNGFLTTEPVELTKIDPKTYTYDYEVITNYDDEIKISLKDVVDNQCNVGEIVSGDTFYALKKSEKKHTPPKIVQSSIFSKGGVDGGFGGMLQSLDSKSRDIFVGDTVTLRVDLEDLGNFYDLNLYFGDFDSVDTMNSKFETSIHYSNGQVTINDKNEVFSEISLIPSKFDGKDIFFLDLTANQLSDSVDVGVYAWNMHGLYVRELNSDAFSIVERIKTAEPGSIEIGNIEMKKIENYKGIMQKQVSSNEHFEPFLIEEKSNAFFEIESQEIIPKLEAKYSQWSEGMISDKEFVEFLAFGIKQKLQDVDTQDPTHSELSNLLSWSTLISNTLEDKNSEQTSMVIDGAYQYMRASLV